MRESAAGARSVVGAKARQRTDFWFRRPKLQSQRGRSGPLRKGIFLTNIWKGLLAGLAAALVLSALMVMPMAGAGLFGMDMDLMAPMRTLVLHLVFGAVLGWVCGKLLSDASGARLAHV